MFPEAKSSDKCVGIVARAAALRQFIELLYVASAQDDIVWFERSDQSSYHLRDIPSPPPFAPPLQSSLTNVVFVRVLPIGKVTEFHRLDNSIDNQRGPQTGSQAQEQHFPALIAAQSLHGCVIDEL